MARVQTVQRQPISSTLGPVEFIGALVNFWRRRDLLWHMTVRHLRGQYKQSVLGYAWSFVNPFSQMIILSFVFSTILKQDPNDGVPFPLFLFVALVPWMFFANSLTAGTDAVVGAAPLVTKVNFPREVLPTAAILSKFVDLAFGVLILAMMMVYYGYAPEATAIWFPLLFAIHLVFIMGLTYPLAALNLYFHDVRFLVGVALTLWFYLTPIIYPVDFVPEKYKILYDLNPNALFINAYRRVILYGENPGLDSMLLGAGIAFATFIIGYWMFKKMEPGFADSI